MNLEVPPELGLRAFLKLVAKSCIEQAVARTNGNGAAAARRLKISTATLYRIAPGRKRCRAVPDAVANFELSESSQATSLLRFFGVEPKFTRKDFWNANSGQLSYLLYDAHRAYLAMVKRHHPDAPCGSLKQMQEINRAWARLEALFKQHGVTR